MIRAIACLALLAIPSAPVAQGTRVSTTDISCGQARAIVQRQGAVVLGTGGFTYERFVASQAFCEREETIRITFAPTLDNPQCPVGYRCALANRPFGRF